MSVRLFLCERWLPGPLRRRMFRHVVALTADAFGTTAPDIRRLSREDAIAVFAEFTRREAKRVLAREDEAARADVRSRLYAGALVIGGRIRYQLGVRSPDDACRALRLVYAAMGIDLRADYATRDIVITRCVFSRTYDPAVCALIASLDQGIVGGITGGSSLAFTERITEGATTCRALLTGAMLR